MEGKFRIILKNKEGEVIKTFEGAYEAANKLDIHVSRIYRYCTTPDQCIQGMYWSKEKKVIQKKVKEKKPKEKKERSTPEMKLRNKETKDETRKRLGLNPYGEWRTETGWAEIERRVFPKLDAIGYFEEGAKAKIKSMLKASEIRRKEDKEGKYVDIDNMVIDPEFQTYFRQVRN
jgi:hypothetical protein